MKSYDTLFDRMMPQLNACPRFVLLDALQLVAVDFFTRSGVWREMLATTVDRGERFVSLPVERGTAFVRMEEVLLDGSPLEGGKHFTVAQAGEGATVEFFFSPDQERTLYARAVLRPARMATALPAAYMDEWGDVFCCGTLAKLKSMSGQHVGWTDPQGAALNMQLYEDGVARARVLAARGRDGRRFFAKGTR